MSLAKSLLPLREKLCSLFDTEEDALRIAEEAGLPRSAIRTGATPQNTWHNILIDAARREKVSAIVFNAGRAYPNHQHILEDLLHSFHEQQNDVMPRYTERRITHILPFNRTKDNVRLLEIPKMRSHENMSDMFLNYAIVRSRHGETPIKWVENWRMGKPRLGSPINGDAVTLIYDLLEWMIIREITFYGKSIYAGADPLRPGDDFDEMPTQVIKMPVETLFQDNIRPNYIWKYGHQQETTIKLPPETVIMLQSLPTNHAVATYGNQPIRKLVIRNPLGSLTVTPSQIWRQVSSGQATTMLRKFFSEYKLLCPLEFQLLTIVAIRPEAAKSTSTPKFAVAYERWLLELQERLVRSMDWENYVEADFRQKIIDLSLKMHNNDK